MATGGVSLAATLVSQRAPGVFPSAGPTRGPRLLKSTPLRDSLIPVVWTLFKSVSQTASQTQLKEIDSPQVISKLD